jgi:hypothetical protein
MATAAIGLVTSAVSAGTHTQAISLVVWSSTTGFRVLRNGAEPAVFEPPEPDSAIVGLQKRQSGQVAENEIRLGSLLVSP